MTTTTGEGAVKANISEAQQLYQRGLAAARGGQKRLAAVLLTRSVQLDPQNERAWLWLSGVLDNPRQQAFCLNAALKINPQNEHARRGLRLLEERNLLRGEAPEPAPGLALPSEPTAAPASPAKPQSEAWWVSFRRNRHEMRWARVILWALPLALVVSALLLFQTMSALALERSQPAALPTAAVAYEVVLDPPRPTIEPILEAEPLAVVESLTVGYLAAVEPLRAELREATAAYRSVTSQPGGASVGHVAATQRLRAAVEGALAGLSELRPPTTLQQAHDDYRKGLELELQGLDAILEFYSGYEVANANRAALRFQESRAYIDRAAASFAAQARQLADLSTMSAHTAR